MSGSPDAVDFFRTFLAAGRTDGRETSFLKKPRHGEDVGLIPQLSFNAPPCGRMVDRHAERLMVAYLNLELAAMFGGEVKSTFEAPLDGVAANRHNYFRMTADDCPSQLRDNLRKNYASWHHSLIAPAQTLW
jgi:hypothetical protein